MSQRSILVALALCCTGLFFAARASAAGPERLAVLEFDVAPGVDVDRIFFSDQVRGEVVARAPQLFVMTRESTDALLTGMGKSLSDCTGECEVETGRNLGADYVVSGRISRVGTRLALSMRLHATADGRLLKTATALGKDVDALVDNSGAAISTLLSALGAAGKPASADKAAASDKPAPLDTPAASDKPVASDKPAALDKPAATDKSVASDKPAALETRTEPKSGLVFVHLPGGTFRYGCEPQDEQCDDNERPSRSKSLASFWLGRTPVTLAAYQRCVDAGACTAAGTGPHCNWGSDRAEHPINCVDFAQANAVCAWLGGRLPSAPEWEYAAKSGESRIYPWGDTPPTGKQANFCDARCPEDWKDATVDDGYEATSPVGAFPAGASKWGLVDLAGNVWQWTSSPFGSKKLKDANKKDVRGGSWHHPAVRLRASHKQGVEAASNVGWGVRCAQ